MELKEYFENNKGTGILATADSEGKVDAAVYARPSVMEDGSLAFIMRDRLTHQNLQSNSHATYMFIEHGPGYKGKRLYLTKLREEEGTELLESLRKRIYIDAKEESKYLVIFNVTKELPLIGDGQAA
jgi:hypothetical protein